ncbi:MAG TPA: hypothetical protein VHE30_00645 [Polyangiaceae bacterium]|nr:hypothetical protein [Polyangiaceae bacterium]
MPTVLRYVQRDPGAAGTPRHRDVAVAGGITRDELDASMDRQGFVFQAIIDVAAPPSSAFPRPGEAFPPAATDRPAREEDRPTPVVASPPAVAGPVAPTLAVAEPRVGHTHPGVPGAVSRGSGGADVQAGPAAELAAELRRRTRVAFNQAVARSLAGEARPAGEPAIATNRVASASPRVELGEASILSTPRVTAWNTFVVYLAVAGSLIVQSPVVKSDFKHDDFLHFYMAEAVPFVRFLMSPFAGHIMAVHRLAYVALKAVFGLDARKFFLVMIGTHCLNVVLLYVFLRRVTRKPALAAFFAGLWGMAPVHTPTMNWFACYGQLQCVAFTLWVFIELVGFADRKEPPTIGAIVRWTILLLLGAASFGLGLVIAVAFPIMAYLVLEPPCAPRRTALSLVPLPFLVAAMWWLSHAEAEGNAAPASAAVHALSMVPRLVLSFAQLAAYGTATLVAPLLTLSFRGRAVFPWARLDFAHAIYWSYPFLALLVAATVVGFFRSDSRARRHYASAFVMIGAAYGIVALTRGALIFDLSFISTQSRYHYGQTTALALLMALSCAAFRWPRLEVGERGTALAALGLALIVFPNRWATNDMDDGFAIGSRDVMVASEKDLATAGRVGAATVPEDRPIYITNTKFSPLLLLFGMGVQRELFPDLGAYWVISHGPDAKLNGHEVRFVASDELVKKVRASDLPRVSRLFVTEREAKSQQASVVDVAPMCFYAPGMTEVVREMPITVTDRANIQTELERCTFTDRAKEAMRREILADPALLEETRRQIRETKDPHVLMQIRSEIQSDEGKKRRYLENAAREQATQERSEGAAAAPDLSATPALSAPAPP